MDTENNEKQNGDLRRLILDTTRHLLVQEGYQNLSMRKIARAIDYSATSIYLHFDSKDALLHALIDEGMRRLYGVLKQTAHAYPDAPVVRLEALCRQFIRFGLENPEYYEIMFLLHPERMERYPPEKYRRARRNLDVIAETLSEGSEQGDFAVDDPRVAASAIWASLHGAVSLMLAERIDVRIDREAFIESTIQQTLRGLSSPARQPAPTSS